MAVQTVAKARFFWKHWERFHDFTSRAAVYAIRTYGGKGGAPRKRRPYPTRIIIFLQAQDDFSRNLGGDGDFGLPRRELLTLESDK